MKINAMIEIDIPDGATHHSGKLDDEPTYYKCSQVGGFDHWWWYDSSRKDWFLSGHVQPTWAKPIPKI